MRSKYEKGGYIIHLADIRKNNDETYWYLIEIEFGLFT